MSNYVVSSTVLCVRDELMNKAEKENLPSWFNILVGGNETDYKYNNHNYIYNYKYNHVRDYQALKKQKEQYKGKQESEESTCHFKWAYIEKVELRQWFRRRESELWLFGEKLFHGVEQVVQRPWGRRMTLMLVKKQEQGVWSSLSQDSVVGNDDKEITDQEWGQIV